MKGKLIVFEGPEGSGKTTQSAILHQNFQKAGISSLLSKEPGQVFNRQLRDILLGGTPTPMAKLLLFLADRAQHVETIVKPALQAGTHVILDRFTDSTIAYQWFGQLAKDGTPVPTAFGNDLRPFNALLRAASGNLVPDLVICIDTPAETRQARLAKRGETLRLAEREALTFQMKVEDYYKHKMPLANSGRFVEVPDFGSPEDLGASIFGLVTPRL